MDKFLCAGCNVNPPWEHRCMGEDKKLVEVGDLVMEVKAVCECDNPECVRYRKHLMGEETGEG